MSDERHGGRSVEGTNERNGDCRDLAAGTARDAGIPGGFAGRRLSRRALLSSAAVAGAAGLAGCGALPGFGSGGSGEPELVEGFEDGLSKYSGATDEPTVSGERSTQGSSALQWISATPNDGTIDTQQVTVERPATMTYDVYYDGGGDAGFLFAVQDTPSGYKSGRKYLVAAREKTGSALRIERYTENNRRILAEEPFSPPLKEFLEVEVEWREDGTIAATARDGAGETVQTVRATDDTYTAGGIGWRSDDNNYVKYYDNLRVG